MLNAFDYDLACPFKKFQERWVIIKCGLQRNHIDEVTDHIDEVCLTATLDILRAIAKGIGPTRAVLALGYAGWSSGQLESEILANSWLTCPADPGLIFDADFAHKYDRALAMLGVDEGMLSSDAGHA